MVLVFKHRLVILRQTEAYVIKAVSGSQEDSERLGETTGTYPALNEKRSLFSK